MNTATRSIDADGIQLRKGSFRISLKGVGMALLIAAILMSAFGVIYLKDLNRRLFIQYQTLQSQKAQSLIEKGKLLLEQSTWSTQSRIQQIARKELGMIIPSAKDIVLVESHDADSTTQ